MPRHHNNRTPTIPHYRVLQNVVEPYTEKECASRIGGAHKGDARSVKPMWLIAGGSEKNQSAHESSDSFFPIAPTTLLPKPTLRSIDDSRYAADRGHRNLGGGADKSLDI